MITLHQLKQKVSMAVISFKHNFAFVKTHKTAGTAIEVSLSPLLPQSDILTEIKPKEEGHKARNHKRLFKQKIYNHMSSSEIKNFLGKEKSMELTFFCIEREPIDKCISHYCMLRYSSYHNKDSSYKLSWEEYVEKGDFPEDVSLYSKRNETGDLELDVDLVLPYQNLEKSLQGFFSSKGLMGFSMTSKAKSGFRKQSEEVPSIDTVKPSHKEKIYKAFEDSLKLAQLYNT